MRKKDQFLFGYTWEPAFWTNEGFSFMIQSDGTAIYKKFLVDDQELSCETIQIENNIVAELKKYLLERKSIIKDLPKETFNGSVDGSYDTFTFLGKSMTSLNADIYIIESPKNEYEKQMIPVFQAEKNAIEIFIGGIDILKKSSHRFTAKNWGKLCSW